MDPEVPDTEREDTTYFSKCSQYWDKDPLGKKLKQVVRFGTPKNLKYIGD